MSPVQSDFSADWPPEPPLAQLARQKRASPDRPAEPPLAQSTGQKRTSPGFILYPMLFGAGIVATLAWQQFGWLASQTAIAPAAIVPPITSPDTREIKTMPFDLAEMSQKIDQLTDAQKQMTREITKLQAVEQYVLYMPPPQPAAAPADTPPTRNPAPKPPPPTAR